MTICTDAVDLFICTMFLCWTMSVLGFWQVETSSLRDFPQQFRTFDIAINKDYTLSIFATNIDPAVKENTPAFISRKYAIAAQGLFNNPLPYQPTGSYNVELLKQLTPKMQDIIKNIK